MKLFLNQLQQEHPEFFTKELAETVVRNVDKDLKDAGISSKEERASLIYEALKDLGLTSILSQLGKDASDQAAIVTAIMNIMQSNEIQNRYSDTQHEQEKQFADSLNNKEKSPLTGTSKESDTMN